MKKKLVLNNLKVKSFTTTNTLQVKGGISGGACQPKEEPIYHTMLAGGCFPTDVRCLPSDNYYSECCPTW